LHIMLRNVTERLESFRFNTAISAMMEFLNFAIQPDHSDQPVSRAALRTFVITLAPFAPHLAEELWERLAGHDSVFAERFPPYDAHLVQRRETDLAVQINGKVRGTVTVATDSPADVVHAAIMADGKLCRYVLDKKIVKTHFVPNRIVNLIVQ
jgi:leucyl-tRNA synthetase